MYDATTGDEEKRMSETTRRTVLAGACGMGAAAMLAACGQEAPQAPAANPGTGAGAGAGAGESPIPLGPGGGAKPSGGAATGGNAGGGAAAGALAKTSEIPVGGGKIFADEKVVVTQPTAGTFKAFSAVCTHAGCTVTSVASGTINCKCHASAFSASDGSPKGGPAKQALAPAKIKVANSQITLA